MACIWVIFHHVSQGYHPTLPEQFTRFAEPGFLGVDLFFVLSGFILVLVHGDLRLRLDTTLTFYIQRLFRVYPLDIALMLFMAADAWHIGVIGPGWYDPHHFLPVLLMIEPYYTNPPFAAWLATNWSVGIELICYLAFPFLLLGLHRVSRAWVIVIICALAAAECGTQYLFPGYFYGIGAILRGTCGFGLGAAGAIIVTQFSRPADSMIGGVEVICLVAIAFLLRHGILWPLPLCFAVLIVGLYYGTGMVARLLATPVFVWLGDISYSIYLVHGVVLGRWSWNWLAELRTTIPDPAASIIWGGLFAAVTVSASALTYYAVERPGVRLGRSIGRRLGRTNLLGAAGLLSPLLPRSGGSRLASQSLAAPRPVWPDRYKP